MKGKSVDELADRLKRFEKFVRNTDATDEAIESCLLYIRQLAQIVEDLTTSPDDESEMPEEPEMEDEQLDIQELQNFINTWTLKK